VAFIIGLRLALGMVMLTRFSASLVASVFCPYSLIRQ
jgi:hypothetical protein